MFWIAAIVGMVCLTMIVMRALDFLDPAPAEPLETRPLPASSIDGFALDERGKILAAPKLASRTVTTTVEEHFS
jgi:hypothetical protein